MVANRDVVFVFSSPLLKVDQLDSCASKVDKQIIREIHGHVSKHGDAVKDVAFAVNDVKGIFNTAVARGAISAQQPSTSCDIKGQIEMATIKTFGDVTHTLIDRSQYRTGYYPDIWRRYLP